MVLIPLGVRNNPSEKEGAHEKDHTGIPRSALLHLHHLLLKTMGYPWVGKTLPEVA